MGNLHYRTISMENWFTYKPPKLGQEKYKIYRYLQYACTIKQSKLRESLTLQEQRLPLAQKLDATNDKTPMHMNGWSSDEESLESYEGNPLWDDSCEQVSP